jgi:DNA excision repair protein ERCC-5
VASKALFSKKDTKSVQKDPNSRIGPQGSAAVFEYRPAEFDPVILEAEEAAWTAERNQRERDADTVTDEMRLEVIQLLRLFGVPYVEAPAEAEAQCVALEQLGLVDGIVTEDSDVFIFGGRTIYKHIFDEMKYVEVYLASDAEKEMGLGRNQMVALAMLLGGDYTEGVKGVGIVNSMELLQAFDVSEDLRKGLLDFRKWLDGFDPMEGLQATSSDPEGSAEELAFHRKHRTARSRWAAPDSFPSEQVIKAYISPVVDKSGDTFSWGSPDVESLCRFCGRTIGWSSEETLQMLEPVINNASSGLRQTRIDSFMKYEDSIKFADVRSKRLRDVLGLKGDTKASTSGKKKKC